MNGMVYMIEALLIVALNTGLSAGIFDSIAFQTMDQCKQARAKIIEIIQNDPRLWVSPYTDNYINERVICIEIKK